jgi:hypothetical protein
MLIFVVILALIFSPNVWSKMKTLLYNHFPKAGGTQIKLVLDHLGILHVVVHEFEATTKEDMANYFVIGSVRAPCSYLLSLYSYGRDGAGELRTEIGRSNHSAFKFIYETDFHTGFHHFVQDQKGIESKRFKQSYPDMGVDCFVRNEYLSFDLLRCLDIYRIRENPSLAINRTKYFDYFKDNSHNVGHHPLCNSVCGYHDEGHAGAGERHLKTMGVSICDVILNTEKHIVDMFPEYRGRCCGH